MRENAKKQKPNHHQERWGPESLSFLRFRGRVPCVSAARTLRMAVEREITFPFAGSCCKLDQTESATCFSLGAQVPSVETSMRRSPHGRWRQSGFDVGDVDEVMKTCCFRRPVGPT